MRFLVKSFLLIILIFTAALYINGCSTAEQTTGKIAYAQGDYQKAELEFEKEIKQNPNNEEAWFLLAMSRFQINKISSAEIALKEYRRIGKGTYDSDIIRLWGDKYDQGYAEFEKGKSSSDTAISLPYYKKAIDYFKTALILMPDSIFVQKNIDVINTRIATIKVKPLIDRGADQIKEEKYEEAISSFKQALNVGIEEDNPVIDVLNYNMGLAYLKWGEQIRESNKDTNPDDQTYKEKYKDALPFIENLTNTNDNEMKYQAYDLLVQVYGNLNMTEKALEAIKIRDELKPKQDENK